MNCDKITEVKAKRAIRRQFRVYITNEVELVVHSVKPPEFQWLNGIATFGHPNHIYFMHGGNVKICTTACSIGNGFVMTSGHNSSLGTDYYKDPGMTVFFGSCVFHSVNNMSDIAIIDTKAQVEGLSIGSQQARILPGSVREVPKCYLRDVTMHTVHGEISCKLKVMRDKVRGVECWAIELPELEPYPCQEGDSGALLTTRQKNGMRCVEALAIGALSGINKFTTSKGAKSYACVLPLGPSYQKFSQSLVS